MPCDPAGVAVAPVIRVCRVRGAAASSSRAAFMACALALAVAASRARADPWLAPGDSQLRQDVELLADSGVLEVPITTWPIPWGELASALDTVDPDKLDAPQQLAYQRLVGEMRAVQEGAGGFGYALAAAPGRPALRWFGATPRGKSEAGAAYSGYSGNMAFRLDVSAVYGSRDHQRGRLDGSYVAFALGSWIFTAGQIERYWGPGWSGSLIYGTNSRPVPGVSLTNYVAHPFASPVLHWLGPWNFTLFAGKLEDARYVAHPFLLGGRFAFHPLKGLEIGFSRTAEWGGAGRPQSWHCLWTTVIGLTNQQHHNVDCANQLGGYDLRYAIPAIATAFYGQAIGEDAAGGLPTKFTDLLGASHWGAIGSDGGNYRAFLEYANTTVNSFKQPLPNIAYENYLYQSGYRFRGFDMGYPTDNDSELWTAGVVLQAADNGSMTFLVRHGTLNVDNTNVHEPWGGNKLAPVRTALDEVDGYFTPAFLGRHLQFGLGITRWAPVGLPAETGVHALVEWQQGFGT